MNSQAVALANRANANGADANRADANGAVNEIDLMKPHSNFEFYDLFKKLDFNLKALAYKSVYSSVTKEELWSQIKIEFNVLNMCQHKIDRKLKNKDNRCLRTEMLASTSMRINYYYDMLFSHFPVDRILLTKYIETCLNNELFIGHCSKRLQALTSSYNRDPSVYIVAAEYEFDHKNNIASARGIYQKAFVFHANCKSLYVNEFWMEIQHLKKSAGALCPSVIEIYEKYIRHFSGDIEFHFMLLDKAIELSDVGELQFHILRDMVKKYRHNELMWQKLAKTNLNGFVYNHKARQLHYNNDDIHRIRNCIKTYEDGLKKNMPPENKRNLWNFFIDHVIEIRKSNDFMEKKIIKNFMDNILERVFQEAHDSRALGKAEHYIHWAENTKKSRYEIIAGAVQVFENCVELWVQLLEYFVDCDSYDMLIINFEKGVKTLKSKSMPLWNIVLLYLQNTHPYLLENIYKAGARYPWREINTLVRPKYLEWYIIQYGIFNARTLFDELKDVDPPCKKLYTSMISYEKCQASFITKNGHTVRKLYIETCDKFGSNDISVWIDCIRFEYTNTTSAVAEGIYKASLVRLEPHLHGAMTEEFEKLKNEFTEDIREEEEEIISDEQDNVDDVIVVDDNE